MEAKTQELLTRFSTTMTVLDEPDETPKSA
jgi:hypothetical protein